MKDKAFTTGDFALRVGIVFAIDVVLFTIRDHISGQSIVLDLLAATGRLGSLCVVTYVAGWIISRAFLWSYFPEERPAWLRQSKNPQ